MTFKKFLESDEENLKRLGLDPSAMRIVRKRPKQYSDEEILGAEYYILTLPATDHNMTLLNRLAPHNGQIVSRDTYHYSDRTGVWIGLLSGRNEEGNSYRVPLNWLKPIRGKSNLAHANWLGDTFFQRSHYVEKGKTDNWKYDQRFHLRREDDDALFTYLDLLDQSRDMRGMAAKIREDENKGFYVADLLIVADMLADLGKQTESDNVRRMVSDYLS